MNIKQQVEALNNKQISATSLVNTCLENIEATKSLNTYITVNTDQALKLAKALDEADTSAPLAGVTFAIKDNINTLGMPTTAGSLGLSQSCPSMESPIVTRLKQAGAIVIGKTNMHEMAFGITGYNHAYYYSQVGVRSYFDETKFAGGSSSGSGVAVCSDTAKFALGTDTGGSVRIPAALNNIVGYRPTIHRYSQQAVVPISHTRDTIGLMTQTVDDAILLDGLITEESPASAPEVIRLGYDESQCLANATEEVKNNWKQVIDKLSNNNQVELVPVDLSAIYQLNGLISFPVALYEAHDDLVSYLAENEIDIQLADLVSQMTSPDVLDTYTNLVIPKKLPAPDGSLVDAKPIYDAAINEHRPELIKTYNEVFKSQKIHAMIAPTTVSEALDAVSETTTLENFGLFIQNTDPTSNAGLPSVSIPSGKTSSGLPLGLLLDGLAGSDQTLLAISKQIATAIN